MDVQEWSIGQCERKLAIRPFLFFFYMFSDAFTSKLFLDTSNIYNNFLTYINNYIILIINNYINNLNKLNW